MQIIFKFSTLILGSFFTFSVYVTTEDRNTILLVFFSNPRYKYLETKVYKIVLVHIKNMSKQRRV